MDARPLALFAVAAYLGSALLLPRQVADATHRAGAALSLALLAVLLRALRTRQLRGLDQVLPPLTLIESLLFQLIGAGFVLLSLTLLTGALFVEDLFGQHLVHKTVLSFAAWVVFGALLFGRW